MKISCIVPTYLQYPSLIRTLQDLCMQDSVCTPVEIVVVADGPDPVVESICEQINRRIEDGHTSNPLAQCVYMHTPAHAGNGSVPRNFGLDRSTGSLVHFVDNGTISFNHLHAHLMKSAYDAKGKPGLVVWDVGTVIGSMSRVIAAEVHLKAMEVGEGYLSGIQFALPGDVARKYHWNETKYCDRDYMQDVRAGDLDRLDPVTIISDTLQVAYGHRDDKESHGAPFSGAVKMEAKDGRQQSRDHP